MSQRLFSVPKVGLFLDTYAPGFEKRRDEKVAIIKMTLRLQPFDAKFATSIDDGLGGDSAVRAMLFKLNHPDPKPHLQKCVLALGCPRQTMDIFPAPDVEASRLAFSQVKITGTYARTQKNENGYAFIFNASYGPLGRDELEFIHKWYRHQCFVTFSASEPILGLDDAGDDQDEDDEGDEQEPTLPGTDEAPAADDSLDREASRRREKRAKVTPHPSAVTAPRRRK